MAEIFEKDTTRQRGMGAVVVSMVVLALVFAAGFLLYYRHINHAFAEVAVTSVQVMPLHMESTHTVGEAITGGAEDATYILAHVTVHNRSDAPLFVKSLNVDLTTADGSSLTSSVFEVENVQHMLAGFPKMRPLATVAGGPPLARETTIAPNATAEGFILFQLAMEQQAWKQRQAAALRVDFYHDQAITAAFPK